MQTLTTILDSNSITWEQTAPNVINLRCPVCGDSTKRHWVKRGYITRKGNEYIYTCHNECGSMSIYNFLEASFNKQTARKWYSGQMKDKYVSRKSKKPTTSKQKAPKTAKKEFNGKSIQYKDKNGLQTILITPVKRSRKGSTYLRGRKLDHTLDQWYYEQKDTAIIIPLYNRKGTFIGFQKRWLEQKLFMTKLFKTSYPRVWNLENIGPRGGNVYVFEGIMDAMSSGFDSSNVIASLGADLTTEVLDELEDWNLIFCYDNDEAGKVKTAKFAKLGYECVIHSTKFPYKDTNEALIKGQTLTKIRKYLERMVVSPKKAVATVRLGKAYKLFFK